MEYVLFEVLWRVDMTNKAPEKYKSRQTGA